MMTIAQAAKYLNRSVKTVRYHMSRGKIKYTVINGKATFEQADLDELKRNIGTHKDSPLSRIKTLEQKVSTLEATLDFIKLVYPGAFSPTGIRSESELESIYTGMQDMFLQKTIPVVKLLYMAQHLLNVDTASIRIIGVEKAAQMLRYAESFMETVLSSKLYLESTSHQAIVAAIEKSLQFLRVNLRLVLIADGDIKQASRYLPTLPMSDAFPKAYSAIDTKKRVRKPRHFRT